MEKSPFTSFKLWKDSAMFAFVLLAGIETLMSIMAISLADVIDKWWERLFLIVGMYIGLAVATTTQRK